MSEITKLYKNAGLSNMWVERYNDGYYEHENYYDSYKEMVNNMMKANDWTLTEAQETAKRECSKEFPPFTAEKQLEIVKFMLHKGVYYDTDCDTYWFHYTGEIENATYRPFEEAIAEFINSLWQDLTEEEKQQIKEILK